MKQQLKVLLGGLIVIICLFLIPLDYYIIAPGKVFNTRDVVTTSSFEEQNHFYAPSVESYENKYFALMNTTLFNKLNTNPFYFFYALLHPSVEAKKLSDYLPKGTTSKKFEQAMEQATEISTDNIRYVVANRLNKSLEEIDITINLTNEGSSVALALALEAINQLSPQDITNGLKIAAVGGLGKTGHVQSVAAVKQKILAAERENLDIIFIPSGDYTEEIKQLQTRIEIIPIGNIDEVLARVKK